MIKITPAILPHSYIELETKVGLIKGATDTIQIDFCDGKFVQNRTWPFNYIDTEHYNAILDEKEGLPFWQTVSFELDLMVTNAHTRFDEWIKLGPSRIIFHIEAEDQTLLSFFEKLDPFFHEHVQFGLALNTTTPIDSIDPYISHISFVQCMGIEHIGAQGQAFDQRVVDQLKGLRARYPELVRTVDGGVSHSTITELVSAGAERLVVGSAIFSSPDPEAMVDELQAQCDTM